MNRLSVLVTAVFGLVLFVLLMLHIAAPWQYANDDNGAWFSAIARSHREAGLQATLGQDFFTSRESGELVPYLHHPPFPGLVLAAAFVVTGVDAPWVARTTFALLHLISFLLIARLACQIPAVRRNMLLFAYVLSVVAVVPMSAF